MILLGKETEINKEMGGLSWDDVYNLLNKPMVGDYNSYRSRNRNGTY